MSDRFARYLHREHSRLEVELEAALRKRFPDELACNRLKKLKLVVKDQIREAERLPA
ncbi:DUF465 domain-containing protein [Sphingomonas quercus]|uniref:DUF465 domain-containing protein n=1 Tax=Sphingomonas quercus TaxID=2842451 RepID=A0ABS6BGN6_9SPHN|nr:DUF465 domain-containing protein [Sphingomonas quercus]MBU3077461.1 DUF465 domain-containing protein [Sphingomonas quercus]